MITTAFNKALLLAAAADHRSITHVTVGNINLLTDHAEATGTLENARLKIKDLKFRSLHYI